jgi:hypothetical protein
MTIKSKHRRRLIHLSLFVLVLLFTIITFELAKEGLQHANTRTYLTDARKYFTDGDYGQSIKNGFIGVRNTLDAGLRWTIAKPHLIKAQSMLHEKNDLYGAFHECEFARTMISSTYDDEGMVDYLCFRIKVEINPEIWNDPTQPIPTKTAIP